MAKPKRYWFSLRVATYFGLHMFNEEGKFLPLGGLSSFVLTIILCGAFIRRLVVTPSQLSSIIASVVMGVLVFSVIISFTMGIYFRRQLTLAFNNLLYLRDKLERISPLAEPTKGKIGFAIETLFVILLVGFSCAIFKVSKNYEFAIVFFSTSYLRTIFCQHIKGFIDIISTNLDSIRLQIRKEDSFFVYDLAPWIFSAHRHVCGLLDLAYGWQIFFYLSSSFCFILVFSYILVLEFTTGDGIFYRKNIDLANSHRVLGLWVAQSVYELISLAKSFSCLQMKAHEYSLEMYNKALEDDSASISKKAKFKTHIKSDRRLTFSPLGLFEINFSLITQMVLAMATYIIILVQFSNVNNPALSTPQE